MPHITSHHSLGASLASVALVAGTLAFTLGWFPSTMLVLGTSNAGASVSPLTAPERVTVSRLPDVPAIRRSRQPGRNPTAP